MNGIDVFYEVFVMKLTPKVTILTLVQAYPFLIDDLAAKNPLFSKLQQTALLKTMGRLATLEKAASLGKENLLDLMLFIAGRIMEITGDHVEIEPPRLQKKTVTTLSKSERMESLKEIIRELHAGTDSEVLKEKFVQTVGDITPEEIAELEQALVKEGLEETEIKKLCNLHVDLFKSALNVQAPPVVPPGHPIHTYMQENERIAEVTGSLIQELQRMGEHPNDTIWSFTVGNLRNLVTELADINTHYVRKENQLFPLLERHGIEAPAKVMWEVHDDIRTLFKKSKSLLQQAEDRFAARGVLTEMTGAIEDMIYKEERILFPMALETLTVEDWAQARHGDDEIGYCFDVTPGDEWLPDEERKADTHRSSDLVNLDTGALSAEVINNMLCNLPVDMSFVDAEGKVAYYSDSSHRIFPRSPAVIGRNVINCHPPKSVHMVTEILEKFKNGERDSAEFWLELGDTFIHIQYIALRSDDGEYLGCLEVGQDAGHVRSLTGQRRLLEWE